MKNDLAVLIPVFNAQCDLIDSLDSIIEDDNSFTVIVVDDGSSEKVIINEKNYKFNIVILYHDKNQGITSALNTGLAYIQLTDKFKYIARLDAGDFQVKNRLLTQYNFMENNPYVYLSGSNATFISEKRETLYIQKMPETYEKIKKEIYFKSCFIHPTIMFRVNIINNIGMYSPDFPSAEDYEFFFRVIKYYSVINLQEPLIYYVVSSQSISSKKRKQQLLSTLKIQYKYFEWNEVVCYLGILRSITRILLPRQFFVLIRSMFKSL